METTIWPRDMLWKQKHNRRTDAAFCFFLVVVVVVVVAIV